MAFLDEIDKRLTELGRGALEKTREASDTVKISNAIRNLENQKKNLFVDLGENFYRMHRDIANGEEMQIIQQIESLEIEIKNNQEQMTRIKGVICCPNCNAEIPAASVFCNVCGTKIEQRAGREVLSNNSKICRQCGAALEDGQTFCTNCGTRVSASPVTEEVKKIRVEHEIPDDSERNVDIQNAETEGAGEVVDVVQAETIIPLVETETVTEETSEQRACAKCGAQVEPEQCFCTQCGNRL